MFYVWMAILTVIVIVAIFNKKKWAHYIGAFVACVGFTILGFDEICHPHETVHWLHVIWGVINILIGLACFVLGFRSIIRLNKKATEDNSLPK